MASEVESREHGGNFVDAYRGKSVMVFTDD